MNLGEAMEVLRFVNWEALLHAPEGTEFPVVIDGALALAVVVMSEDKEDYDNNRTLKVIVRIGDQFFRKTGWAQIGSHCYGEYTPSWDDLKEVFPHERTIVEYKEVESD